MVVPGERGMWVCAINPSSGYCACTSGHLTGKYSERFYRELYGIAYRVGR